MLQSLRAALEVTYGVSDVWSGIGYVGLTLAVLLGGTIVWFLLMAGLRFLLQRGFTKREVAEDLVAFDVDRADRKLLERKPTRSCGNVIYVVVQTLLLAGLVAIVWIAFASAGFNVWTTAAASLGLSIMGTYGLMTPISLWFNGYTAAIAKSVVVGEHVEFHGMGPEWSGRVIAIHSLSVDIVRWDEASKSDEIITMPISRFLDQPRKRNFKAERVLDSLYGQLKRLLEYKYGGVATKMGSGGGRAVAPGRIKTSEEMV